MRIRRLFAFCARTDIREPGPDCLFSLLLYASSGSLYVSAERQELLFGTGCLRTLKPCRPPTDPYYSATNYGLDAMVKQMVEQSQLLANDPLSQLTPNNERYRFIESVSPTDLFDAQTTSVKLYDVQSTQPAAVAQWMQIAVLPCLFAGKVIFLSRFFKPWIQQTLHETKRVAELLAQLPKEINVNAVSDDSTSLLGASFCFARGGCITPLADFVVCRPAADPRVGRHEARSQDRGGSQSGRQKGHTTHCATAPGWSNVSSHQAQPGGLLSTATYWR